MERVRYKCLWGTKLVRKSDLVMKPVRYEAMGKTILFFPSCFTGSPDYLYEWTPVLRYFLALRPGTQMWSGICKPESDIVGILFINKSSTSVHIKVLHKNLIPLDFWVNICKIHPLMPITIPTYTYLPHLEGMLWVVIFHNKITILYNAQT